MMSRLSLADKLKILGDVTSSSGLFVVAIVILVALALLVITTNTKTKKISKFVCMAIYGSITLVSLIFYREELFNMLDYMMNNFFIAVYFPNLAIYFAAIIATNIILWISIFNRKITKWIRAINTIVFCIIHYLLILIINIITTNKLDIFEQTSIYQNENALALIELSSTIFIVWILFLIIYKIIRIYQQKKEEDYEQLERKNDYANIEAPIPEPIIKQETIYKRKLPDSIIKTEVPRIIHGSVKREPTIKEREKKATTSIVDFMKTSVENDNSYLMDIPNFVSDDNPQFLDMMLESQNNKKEEPRKVSEERKTKDIPKKQKKIKITEGPLIVSKSTLPKKVLPKQKQSVDVFDNLLTLDDYKKVLALLKSYKAQEQLQAKAEQRAENKRISIDDFQQLVSRK